MFMSFKPTAAGVFFFRDDVMVRPGPGPGRAAAAARRAGPGPGRDRDRHGDASHGDASHGDAATWHGRGPGPAGYSESCSGLQVNRNRD